jgi:L-alanine-DL-glutamate epimerase-like enolase superfamily enzyme
MSNMAAVARIEVHRGSAELGDQIRIHTACGLTGFGVGRWCEQALRAAPGLLLGRSAFEFEAIYEDLTAAGGETPGGLDMALWDICGKALHRPARELFGKTYRTRVAVNPGEKFAEAPTECADLPVASSGASGLDALVYELVQEKAIDIAIPDIAAYGLTGLRRLAYLCWVFRVRLAVRCSGSALSTMAALQAAACFAPVSNAIAAPAPFLLIPPDLNPPGDLEVPVEYGLGVTVAENRGIPDFALGG